VKVKENVILRAALILLPRMGFRLWRNNCGAYRLANRYIRYGVANPGGSDLLGFKSVVITPEMVGQKVAIFTAVECKSSVGKLTDYQQRFLDEVRDAGGIVQVVNSIDQLK
jgi:hypothetical protein